MYTVGSGGIDDKVGWRDDGEYNLLFVQHAQVREREVDLELVLSSERVITLMTLAFPLLGAF